MAFVNVYRQPLHQDFKADIFSFAVLFQILLFAITIGVPIALVAINPDSWPLYTTSYEQPVVKYQRMAIAYLNLDGGTSISWSTISNFNQLRGSSSRAAILKVREEDISRDAKVNMFHFSLDIPIDTNERVFGLTMLLFFDYELQHRTDHQMSTAAIIQYSSSSSGVAFHTDGFLELVQKLPLRQGVTDMSLMAALVNQSSQTIEEFSLQLLSTKLLDRPMQTRFVPALPIWTTGETGGQPFHMEVTIRIPPSPIWIQTTILHRFATAGSQFVFWLVLFWIGSWWVSYIVFANRLIPTIRQPEKYSVKKYFIEAERKNRLLDE